MRTVVFFALLASLPSAIATAAPIDSDMAAAQRISGYLQESGQLRNYRIGVTFEDGIAKLEGTVASAEQHAIALRLARRAPDVKRVISKLQYPNGDTSPVNENPRGIAGSRGHARQAAARNVPSDGVVQAYDKNAVSAFADAQRAPGYAAPPAANRAVERSPMLSRTSRPMGGPRPMSRGNMPLPAPRPGVNAAIRQVSAQGFHPAGGPCPDGSCGPMGGAMCGPEGAMGMGGMGAGAAPMGFVPHAHGRGPSYENAQMPGYAWPSYASYPNYAALTYPRQYSPTAWPYIGPFYPYPQVPLAWRKVSLEWDDGWWFLDFSAHNSSH